MEDWQRERNKKEQEEQKVLEAQYRAEKIAEIMKSDEKEILAEILFQLKQNGITNKYQLEEMRKEARKIGSEQYPD